MRVASGLAVALMLLAGCATSPRLSSPSVPRVVEPLAESYRSPADAPRILQTIDEQLFQRRLSVTDLSTPDLTAYGNLLLAASRWDDAQSAFALLEAREPNEPSVLKTLTLLSLDRETPAAQEAHWQKWAHADPHDPDLDDVHARILKAKGDLTGAQQLLQTAAQTRDPAALIALAALSLAQKNAQASFAWADQAVKAAPNNDQAWAARARAYDALHQPLRARTDWDKAIALAPRDPWHRLDRGQLALRELYDNTTAQTDLELATAGLPDNVLAWEASAEVAERQNRDHDAWRSWMRVAELRPDYRYAYPSLAMLSFHFQDFPHAAQYAHLAGSQYPAEYGFPLVEALSLMAQGQSAAAVIAAAAPRYRGQASVNEFFRFLQIPGSDFSLNTTLQQEKDPAVRTRLRFYQGAYYALLKQPRSAQAALEEVSQSDLHQLPEVSSAAYWLDHGR